MTAARPQAAPPDLLARLAMAMAQPAGRSQAKTPSKSVDAGTSPALSFPALLVGMTDAESPAPAADPGSGSDLASALPAGEQPLQLPVAALPPGMPASLLPTNSLEAGPHKLTDAVEGMAPPAAAPPPHAPPQRKHFVQATPERGSAESAPAEDHPAVADAPAPPQLAPQFVPQVQPAPVDPVTILPAEAGQAVAPAAPRALDATLAAPSPQATHDELPGPAAASVPADTGNLARTLASPVLAGEPAELPARQPAASHETATAAAGPVLTPQRLPVPSQTESGFAAEPASPGRQPAAPVAAKGREYRDQVMAPDFPGPEAGTQPPQDRDATRPVVLPQTAQVADAGAPGSAANTDPAAPAGSRIAAQPVRSPQPAKVFAKNSADPSVASVVPWVPPAPAAAQEALAIRFAPLEETPPTPPPTSPSSPSGDTGLASHLANAVPVPVAPPAGKATARRLWDMGAAQPHAAHPVPVVGAGISAGALEPVKAATQSDSQPAAEPSPMPIPSSVAAAPGPVVPNVADSPTVPQDRIPPARTQAEETGRGAARGFEGVGIANFASFADRAVAATPATQPVAGPPAFEALLTPQPQMPPAAGTTPAPESAAPGSTAVPALGAPPERIEVPTAGIAPQIEPSGDLSWQAAGTAPDGGESAPATDQTTHPASRAGKPDATARPEAGRKQAAAPVTVAPAAAPGTGSATAVRGTPVDNVAGGETRAAAAVPRASEDGLWTADARLEPEAPKTSAPARNMQFSVGTGDQRVEVRVAERDGELHVAVHTPDQRLAGSLRDDLPSLAARLESAGLRTQTWHAGSSDSSGRERLMETSSRTPSQNSQDQPGQDGRRRQDDPPPQRAKRPEDSSHPKPDQKDFQWHLTSLR